MSVLRQQESHFSSSQHGIQSAPKVDEPIANYLAGLSNPPSMSSKRNTCNGANALGYYHSATTIQKRKSVGSVIDKLLSKVIFLCSHCNNY
jgi:hypothetical protein